MEEIEERVMVNPAEKVRYSLYKNLVVVFDDHCNKPVTNTMNPNNFTLMLCDAKVSPSEME